MKTTFIDHPCVLPRSSMSTAWRIVLIYQIFDQQLFCVTTAACIYSSKESKKGSGKVDIFSLVALDSKNTTEIPLSAGDNTTHLLPISQPIHCPNYSLKEDRIAPRLSFLLKLSLGLRAHHALSQADDFPRSPNSLSWHFFPSFHPILFPLYTHNFFL